MLLLLYMPSSPVLLHIYCPCFSTFWHCHPYILQHFNGNIFTLVCSSNDDYTQASETGVTRGHGPPTFQSLSRRVRVFCTSSINIAITLVWSTVLRQRKCICHAHNAYVHGSHALLYKTIEYIISSVLFTVHVIMRVCQGSWPEIFRVHKGHASLLSIRFRRLSVLCDTCTYAHELSRLLLLYS